MTTRNLYLVTEGIVTPAIPSTPWDGDASVLVYAADDKDAVRLAALYDDGALQARNLPMDGTTVACIAIDPMDAHILVTEVAEAERAIKEAQKRLDKATDTLGKCRLSIAAAGGVDVGAR